MNRQDSGCPIRVASETTLSTRGSTRATSYVMSNKIITHQGRTHVGWLDHMALSKLVTLDSKTGTWSEPATIGEGVDNHCGPALTIDRDGRLHAMVGSHGVITAEPPVPFQHRVSVKPNDASLWEPPVAVGSRPTYPSLVCDRENRLHVVYRGRMCAPTWMWNMPAPSLLYQRKSPGGDWPEPVELLRPSEPYGYVFYCGSLFVDFKNRLHLTFIFYEGHPNGRGHAAGYMRSDNGGQSWHAADGSPLRIPAGPKTVDVLRTSSDLNMFVSNVACDSHGQPYVIVFDAPETGGAELYWHDGTSWQRRTLLEAVRAVRPGCFISRDGAVAFGRDDNLYIALQTVTKAYDWGDHGAEVVLLYSADQAKTLSGIQVSDSPDVPNWQPRLERVSSFFQDTPEVPALLYTHGNRGATLVSEDYTDVRFVTFGRC